MPGFASICWEDVRLESCMSLPPSVCPCHHQVGAGSEACSTHPASSAGFRLRRDLFTTRRLRRTGPSLRTQVGAGSDAKNEAARDAQFVARPSHTEGMSLPPLRRYVPATPLLRVSVISVVNSRSRFVTCSVICIFPAWVAFLFCWSKRLLFHNFAGMVHDRANTNGRQRNEVLVQYP